MKRIFASNTKSKSLKHISKHYDLGNDFFSLWLDKTLTYSSAIFEEPNQELFAAQNNKYQKLIDLIEPSNGAEVKPIISNGSIVKVLIEKTAIGFDERPRIFVDSDTGFNAELIPVFTVKEVDVNEPIPLGTRVISVVDCVGKHSAPTK